MTTHATMPSIPEQTREEWAEDKRALKHYPPRDYAISHFATPDEVAELIAELRAAYRVFGAKMKAANAAAGPFGRQKGETWRAWDRRWLAMPRHIQDGESLSIAARCGLIRGAVFRALKEVRAGEVPYEAELDEGNTPRLAALLDVLHERCAAKGKADIEAARRKAALTPVDDAAWQQHLDAREKSKRMNERDAATGYVVRCW